VFQKLLDNAVGAGYGGDGLDTQNSYVQRRLLGGSSSLLADRQRALRDTVLAKTMQSRARDAQHQEKFRESCAWRALRRAGRSARMT
jgi:hypothetical protein